MSRGISAGAAAAGHKNPAARVLQSQGNGCAPCTKHPYNIMMWCDVIIPHSHFTRRRQKVARWWASWLRVGGGTGGGVLAGVPFSATRNCVYRIELWMCVCVLAQQQANRIILNALYSRDFVLVMHCGRCLHCSGPAHTPAYNTVTYTSAHTQINVGNNMYLDKFVIKGRGSVCENDVSSYTKIYLSQSCFWMRAHMHDAHVVPNVVTACSHVYGYWVHINYAWQLWGNVCGCVFVFECVCVFLLCCKPSAIITNKQHYAVRMDMMCDGCRADCAHIYDNIPPVRHPSASLTKTKKGHRWIMHENALSLALSFPRSLTLSRSSSKCIYVWKCVFANGFKWGHNKNAKKCFILKQASDRFTCLTRKLILFF